MKDTKLYNILDLIEEIENVDKMIDLHKTTDSKIMYNQYSNQKMKLSGLLFKELLTNTDQDSEIMFIIKLFLEKFYDKEIRAANFSEDSYLEKIRDVMSHKLQYQ